MIDKPKSNEKRQEKRSILVGGQTFTYSLKAFRSARPEFISEKLLSSFFPRERLVGTQESEVLKRRFQGCSVPQTDLEFEARKKQEKMQQNEWPERTAFSRSFKHRFSLHVEMTLKFDNEDRDKSTAVTCLPELR